MGPAGKGFRSMNQNRKRRLFYLWDEAESAREWGQMFEKTCQERGDLELIKLKDFSGDYWHSLLHELKREASSNDLLISRPKDNLDTQTPLSKSQFQKLEHIFDSSKIFPRIKIYQFFDDKKKQCDFLKSKGFPLPKTAWVENQESLVRFIEQENLVFPLVRKDSRGHDGIGVSLILDLTQMHYPGLVQEFCGGLRGEMRLICIGNKVTGYFRKCHPFDFKASGSGRKETLSTVPAELLMIMKSLFLKFGFYSGCVDFIQTDDKRWVITEFSYLWPLRNLPYLTRYWDLNQPSEKPLEMANSWVPSDWILKDMVAR